MTASSQNAGDGRWPAELAARVFREGDAPTPFLEDELRRGCSEGRRTVTRSVSEGKPEAITEGQFVGCDATGALWRRRSLDAGGNPAGDWSGSRSTWSDYRAHASMPADETTISFVERQFPFAPRPLPCYRYVRVASDSGAQTKTERFWFLCSTPGPPARIEIEVGGRIVFVAEWMSDSSLEQVRLQGR